MGRIHGGIESWGKFYENGIRMVTDQTESSTERTTRLTIDTQPAINGWFKVALNGDTKAPWDDDGVLSGISEYTWLLVHLDIYSGPFPDNLITVTSQQDVLGCIPGYTYNCEISCDASGNSVKSFRVYKESEDGQQDVTDVEKYVERFKQIVTAKLDMEGNFDGDYVCEADDGQGNSQRHRVQVMELETPASVEIDRGNIETLENGTILHDTNL
nr:hypothetical protein BaRGS_033629 [Batillaria attramentaria]